MGHVPYAGRVLQTCLAILTLVAADAAASSIRVEQDGSGDYTTIEAAVAAAASGDSLLIGPGDYAPPAPIEFSKDLVFIGDPATAAIDGREAIELFHMNAADVQIIGLTFKYSSLNAVTAARGTMVLSNSRFLHNGIGVRATSCFLSIENCEFRGNSGAVIVESDNTAPPQTIIAQSTFFENLYGVSIRTGAMSVTRNLFVLNGVAAGISPISGPAADGVLSDNTFDSNGVGNPANPAILLDAADVEVRRNIIANSQASGIWLAAPAVHGCNIFWNNGGSDIAWGSLAPGEVVADPQFCEPFRSYTVSASSPALAGNNVCGVRIGAFGQGCGTPQPPMPRVVTVRSDGSGDYDNLTDAVDASVSYDTILVGPGTYVGKTQLRKPLVLRSSDGHDVTRLDGQGMRGLLVIDSSVDVTIRGFSIENGQSTGGAVKMSNGAGLHLRDCLFTGNAGRDDGSAVYGRGADSLTVDACRFEDNNGGIYWEQGACVVTRSEFVGNIGLGGGGAALFCFKASLRVEDCLFAGNVSGHGGALYFAWGLGNPFAEVLTVTGNSFHGNDSPFASADLESYPGNGRIERNIFSHELTGYGMFPSSNRVVRDCNVFWDNAAGPVPLGGLVGNEVSADPLFCNPSRGDFHLAQGSPALPDGSACGLQVGAYGAGCLPTATFIQAFAADPVPRGVQLNWDILSDDEIAGFRIEREDGGAPARVLANAAALPPSERAFVDESVRPGGGYTYTLFVMRAGDTDVQSAPVRVDVPAVHAALAQNVPNPFNPSTRIAYSVPRAAHVMLEVFDVSGRRVRTLVDRSAPAGPASVAWDGRDDAGRPAASGVYFYRVRMAGFTATRKMLLVR